MSRSRSASRGRIEKAVVRHSEFRPRVPEKDKEKEKKIAQDAKKDKKSSSSGNSSTTTASAVAIAAAAGKKLPFIGKMPVFKKVGSSSAVLTAEAAAVVGDKLQNDAMMTHAAHAQAHADATAAAAAAYGAALAPRLPPPTAAQIQMAMMEDAFGNAPPFHPDAGVMMDYDDLMPDPVQFVNIMQAPPPPPPNEQGAAAAGGKAMDAIAVDDDADILPPGIDECEETEEFVPKSTTAPPGSRALPQEFEEALNIIFPGEKKFAEEAEGASKSKGNYHLIVLK